MIRRIWHDLFGHPEGPTFRLSMSAVYVRFCSCGAEQRWSTGLVSWPEYRYRATAWASNAARNR